MQTSSASCSRWFRRYATDAAIYGGRSFSLPNLRFFADGHADGRTTMTLTRRVGGVALGTAIGQGAVILSTPVLARLYEPAAFGELALFMTLASYAAAVGCLRFDIALASCRPDQQDALLRICQLSAAGLAVAAGLLCALPWQDWTGSELARLSTQPVLVAATIGAVAYYQAVSNDLVSRNQFGRLARLRALQGLGFAALALFRAVGLSSALAGGFVLAALSGTRRMGSVSWHRVAAAAREKREFPLLSLPGALCDVLACSMVIIVMTDAYGLVEVGQYAQVQRLMGAPLLLVSASLFQVYLKRTTDDHEAGRALVAPLLRTTAWSLAIVASALLAVAIAGEPLMKVLLGPNWRVDAPFLLLVLGGLAMRVCVSPFSSMLFITGRMKVLLAWQVAYLVTSAAVLPWAAHHVGFDTFLLVHVAHESLLYGAYYFLIYRAARAAELQG